MFILLGVHIWLKTKTKIKIFLEYMIYQIIQRFQLKRWMKKTTSTHNIFRGRFGVLSSLLTPFKLNVYKCPHRHNYESNVHSGSMIDIIIPQNCFIVFHSVLVYCGTPSWYIESGVYHTNTRSFFSIVEKFRIL